jgi:hypothetical protein
MFAIRDPPWGNAALLLHTANASAVREAVLRWGDVHNLDWSLMGAHAMGWISMVASELPVLSLSKIGRQSTLD